jgi:ubiquinone/menaquinone biosynthesis C-methylase UbiE
MDRPSLRYKITKAITSPSRILPYFARKIRNLRLQFKNHNPIAFYASIVDINAVNDPDLAIGSSSREHWITVGDLQIEYLAKHMLKPSDFLLDLGCGNLRAGRRLIDYLDKGHYTGVDISPNIIISASKTISEFSLQSKKPYIYLIDDSTLSIFANESFDVIQANSVYSHMPMPIIKESLSSCFRVLKQGGFFDFTYFEIPDGRKEFLSEDFYYTREAMMEATKHAGFEPEFMHDWLYVQNKIRAHKR